MVVGWRQGGTHRGEKGVCLGGGRGRDFHAFQISKACIRVRALRLNLVVGVGLPNRNHNISGPPIRSMTKLSTPNFGSFWAEGVFTVKYTGGKSGKTGQNPSEHWLKNRNYVLELFSDALKPFACSGSKTAPY